MRWRSDRLLLGDEAGDSRDRPERLLEVIAIAVVTPVRIDGSKNCPSRREPPVTQLRAVAERVGDVPLHLGQRGPVDQRPDVHALGEAVGDLEVSHRRREPGRRTRRRCPPARASGSRRCTSAPSCGTCRRSLRRDRRVQIGVVEDDERSVAAELERDVLHLRGALRHQQLPHLGRACEPELAHDRVGGHLAADRRRVVGVAGHDGEHPWRHSRLLRERGDRRGRRAASAPPASAPSCSPRRAPAPTCGSASRPESSTA